MAIHSSILAWKIPWTEEPDGPQSISCKKQEMTEHTYENQDKTTHNWKKKSINQSLSISDNGDRINKKNVKNYSYMFRKLQELCRYMVPLLYVSLVSPILFCVLRPPLVAQISSSISSTQESNWPCTCFLTSISF